MGGGLPQRLLPLQVNRWCCYVSYILQTLESNTLVMDFLQYQGLSWGALIGVDVTDYVIVLKNIEAVTAFATGNPSVTPKEGSQSLSTPAPTSAVASWNPMNTLSFGGLRLNGEIDVALGSLGRVGYTDLHVGEHGAATAFSYCHSRGLYAGISFGGSLMFARYVS